MIYTIEKAEIISEQLNKFTTGHAHHVTGHFSNIDFWLKEVKEALETIDTYKSRFYNLRDSQKKWIKDHGAVVSDYCPICRGKCEFGNGKPKEPIMMSNKPLENARIELVNSAYYFLTRCFRQGLLDEKELKEKCDFIGTGIDPADLK